MPREGARERSASADAVRHGGRLGAAQRAFPAAPGPWLDLSTGINPDPWRGERAGWDDLARLPDPDRIAALEAAAAAAFGVRDPAQVIATAGAEAGLRWLARLLPAARVAIVAPTYSGHEAAWRLAGPDVVRIGPDAVATCPADALVLVNPNNPDGQALSRGALAALIADRAAARRWTIVDESFVETAPELSVADLASDRLVVLRSFGKFYGLAGLRLGFVVAPPALADQLRAAQGDWPVGGEAIELGIAAYRDTAWQAQAREALAMRAPALDAVLREVGLSVIGGTALFRLVSTPAASRIFEGLCEAAILTRPFEDQAQWLRFGLPRAADLPRLAAALRTVAP